jgi:hypothetical protein
MGFGLWGPAAAVIANAANALELMEFSADQECCRPIYLQDPNTGRPLLAKDSRDVHVWDERPFKTGNLLGKPSPGLNIGPDVEHGQTTGAQTLLGQCWYGCDRQHNEDVALIMHLLLTDDHVSKFIAGERIELLLGALRTDTGNPTIDGIDTGRAARASIMACRYLEVFPDREDLRQVLAKRLVPMIDSFIATGMPGGYQPLQIYGPTNQAGGLPTVDHWRPWEDAIAAWLALCLFQTLSGQPSMDALTLARGLATNIVRHGYRKQPDGSYEIAVALGWLDGGRILTEEELDSPATALWARGTAYALWSYVAAVICWNSTLSMGPISEADQEQAFADLVKAKAIMDSIVASDPGADIAARLERFEWIGIEVLPAPQWLSDRMATA